MLYALGAAVVLLLFVAIAAVAALWRWVRRDDPAREADVDASHLIGLNPSGSGWLCHRSPAFGVNGSDERSRCRAAYYLGAAPRELWWSEIDQGWVLSDPREPRRRSDPPRTPNPQPPTPLAGTPLCRGGR